ncbi:polyprenol phosphomannose-dependent alpha 1,6 mannosyltransferase MptB [Actinoplanes sp. NBRC 103695]|uniref:polyprenol phosphomannose-dependent alpha 1,6 mannosyltransferase MptB n=1 Tax=Actinoplanes sp. NBRC 103695 TaxID=3032202 RepID=UPI0024A59F97|nr:polyprenol phosphomannose-dependent alpha 1,6 mannosyltransferase MptB [Actinoplanes sp. NBRC 103695]GLZ02239.1 membrane protein [Actinoplanes sp. NBRC 103695]
MTIRWAGFAAAGLLALAGALGGAHPGGNVASTPITVATSPYGPLVLVAWLLGTTGLVWAWWTLRDRVPSARWAVGTVLIWAVPFLVVPPMGSRDVFSYACQGHLFVNGLSPYTSGVDTLPCPWVEAVSPIWRDTPAPYGPLFVLAAAAAVALGGSLTGVILLLRLLAVVALAVTALALPPLARRCGVPVGRALWVALAGPLIGAHLVGGPHNDALMIAAVVGAMAVLVIGRSPVDNVAELSGGRATLPPTHKGGGGGGNVGARILILAGVLLGLAVAIKVTAIVALPFVALLAVPRPLRFGSAARALVLIGGVAAGAMAAVTAATGLGLGWLAGMTHTGDLIQFTSPPTAVGMTTTYLGRLFWADFDAVPAVRLIAILILGLLVLWLWVRALRSDEPVRAALRGAAFASAAMIALAPSFHPWYVMFPLILLAVTTTRTDLVMAATGVAAFLVLPDGGGLARYVKFPGAPIATIVIGYLIYRYRPRPGKSRAAAVEPELSRKS